MPATTSPKNLDVVDAITAAAFPVPALAQRTNDPAVLARIAQFADHQAAVAQDLAATIAHRLHTVPGDAERMVVLTLAAAQHWRYRLAVDTSEVRRGAGIPLNHARYRTPITDSTTNYDRIGYVGRVRDGAHWDPAFRIYRGGAATPAFHTLMEAGRRALARYDAEAPHGAVLQNFVELPDGTLVLGNRLLRGYAADDAAKELTARIAARGDTGRIDTGRIETGGTPIYTATATAADRARLYQAAITAFAAALITTDAAAALRSWVHGAYCLYQAPQTKKGSDAVARVALIAFGTLALGHVPQLPHDIDLRGYVDGQTAFTRDLQALQRGSR
ncbi:hypothetical protein ACFORH_43145 [Amycolatopsis roodepoortensis]|uniref:Uncharacterized protein n=1 Tax=Amycolatopsis roodepoortensis TaxID=700274 RepID=A0ABR9LIR6_9PSEU|nr:hypothetical protein [Amycolatopsis roodepoortensis]MBE1580462.1 hypothetical protein [Amycolatopsis roodepoortensis]